MKKAMLGSLEGERRFGGISFVRMAVLCLCFAFVSGTPAQQPEAGGTGDTGKPKFTTFDVPAAGSTGVSGINAAGTTVGSYGHTMGPYTFPASCAPPVAL